MGNTSEPCKRIPGVWAGPDWQAEFLVEALVDPTIHGDLCEVCEKHVEIGLLPRTISYEPVGGGEVLGEKAKKDDPAPRMTEEEVVRVLLRNGDWIAEQKRKGTWSDE